MGKPGGLFGGPQPVAMNLFGAATPSPVAATPSPAAAEAAQDSTDGDQPTEPPAYGRTMARRLMAFIIANNALPTELGLDPNLYGLLQQHAYLEPLTIALLTDPAALALALALHPERANIHIPASVKRQFGSPAIEVGQWVCIDDHTNDDGARWNMGECLKPLKVIEIETKQAAGGLFGGGVFQVARMHNGQMIGTQPVYQEVPVSQLSLYEPDGYNHATVRFDQTSQRQGVWNRCRGYQTSPIFN